MYTFAALNKFIMLKKLNFYTIILSSLFFAGCGLLGIHIKIHNPKSAGKYKISKNDALLGDLNEEKKCYDVKFYDLAIQVFPNKKKIRGTVKMNAIAVNDFKTLEIDLHPNLKVLSILVNGEVATYTRNESVMMVTPKQEITKGSAFNTQVTYEGKPVEANRPPWEGGTVWKEDENKKPWLGVACEGFKNGSSIWWPGKDHSSDEPDSFAIAITVPQGLTAVSNGVLQKTDYNSIPDSTTWYWKNHYSINNYNITYYVGDFALLEDSMQCIEGTLKINHYVLAQNYEKAKEHFQQVKKIIRFYEKTFGAYPWMKDGFKLVESPFAGMEHQSAIAYGNGYKNDEYNIDYIILHETAHEWFGNSVSAADLAHGWIHEGFATYCEALYFEDAEGKNAYESAMFMKRLFIKNSRPVVGPMNKRWFWYKDGDMYMKGAWILGTLRANINNDKIFFDILKTFYQENQRSVILSDNFQKLVEQKTGNNYDWFFNQYLYKRETPVLEYFIDQDNYLYYRWTKCNSDFKLSIKAAPSFNKYEQTKNWSKISPSATEIKKTKLLINALYITFDDNEKLYGKVINKKLPELLGK